METDYKKYGWWFIRFSVFTVVLFLIDYKIQCIFKISNLAELGTLVSGISGVFAALASLFFVLDNLSLQREALEKQTEAITKQNESIQYQREDLKLQREDLKLQRVDIQLQLEESKKSNQHYDDQNKLMQKQQNENTFFVLIDLHKKLYNELNFELESENFIKKNYLDRLQDKIHKNSTDYINSIANQKFNHCNITAYNPKFYYSINEKTKDKYLKMYIDNVKDIIRFIHSNLENSTFYHTKFYNLLFPTEKYLVGMCQKLDMYDFYSFCEVQSQRFNYNEYYDSLITYNYGKGYIPVVNIEMFGFVTNSLQVDFKNLKFNLKISIINNIYPFNNLTIKEVSAIILYDDNIIDTININITNKKFINDEVLVDFSNVIENILLSRKDRYGKVVGDYKISFNCVFSYDISDFTIIHNEKFGFTKTGSIISGSIMYI